MEAHQDAAERQGGVTNGSPLVQDGSVVASGRTCAVCEKPLRGRQTVACSMAHRVAWHRQQKERTQRAQTEELRRLLLDARRALDVALATVPNPT